MEGMTLLIVALFGACVGSFTNVVVWRLPRQESVVVPGSHCPHCGHAIRWHDNLPLLGWLLWPGAAETARPRSAGVIQLWKHSAQLFGCRLWRLLRAVAGDCRCGCCRGRGCR